MAGGGINNGSQLETADGHLFFLKWRDDPPPGMYAAEAEGLAALSTAVSLTSGQNLYGTDGTGGIHTSGVVRVGPNNAWPILGFVPAGPRGLRSNENLGRGLAAIHATPTVQQVSDENGTTGSGTFHSETRHTQHGVGSGATCASPHNSNSLAHAASFAQQRRVGGRWMTCSGS